MIQLIYAYAGTKTVEGKNEYAFGLNGGLPWGHISQDLKNFKARTEGTILIMGAKTFMSLPSPLKGRKHVVVQDMKRDFAQAQDGLFADLYMSPLGFSEWLGTKQQSCQNINGDLIYMSSSNVYSVIGGAGLLQEAYPFADKVIQTSITKRHRVNSDVQLPMSFIIAPSWENSGFEMKETHFYKIDEVTSISETVYVKTRL
ncbi:dihydrofolate reductase [Kosakonia phage Kc304]|uniref:dihydrofolate reductase n=2 Tax=Winklervirus chi14 TaxID=2560752 RepID=A0A1Z1LYP8_9CAUD|nr:dihydrofolate reductase [Serratia phage CHI14]ARW57660.1 dihydrofolate reductase [Serratia phage CHI14]ARW57935.1 dihydrofolate reductase [Serratia phage CBH8]QYN80680.1 dihydrofolate reductase [Kosakonia phage Kc304]